MKREADSYAWPDDPVLVEDNPVHSEDNPVLTRLHLNVYPVNTRIQVLMIRCYHWSFHQTNVYERIPSASRG